MVSLRSRFLSPLIAAGAALLLVLTALGTGVAVAAPSPSPSPSSSGESVPGKLLLMLDASGSMLEADPSGLTRMDAAKKGLTAVVNGLPANAQVGLRVYGATVQGGTPTPEACADTQLVHPIGALDKAGLTAAINAFAAKGETPIAHSLQKAIEDLGPTGKRNIVLVSDGEESCVPDPCPVIKELLGNGIDLQIDTVGYAVGDKARQQLQCIADAGHGTYYDAANADQVASSINRLSQRAMRPFALTGTPITGVDLQEGEQATSSLPKLAPGQFLDTLNTGKHWRSYALKRTIPGSTLHVSVTTRPEELAGSLEAGDLAIRALSASGKECQQKWGYESGGVGVRTPGTATIQLLGGANPRWPDRVLSDCQTGTDYTIQIQRKGQQPATQAEVLVIEEPPVTNLDALAKEENTARDASPVTHGPEQEVIGGLAFSDATTITAGTWVDTLVPGELLVYKVKVEDGQKATFQIKGPTGGFTPPAVDRGTLWIAGVPFGPDRQKAGNSVSKADSFSATYGDTTNALTTGEVRYRNRFYTEGGLDPEYMRAASMSGWYYYTVGVGLTDLGEKVQGQPIKVAFTVQVDGQPSNAVKYQGGSPTVAGSPSPSASPSASANASTPEGASDNDASILPLVGGALLALAVLGGIGYAVWRRRATPAPSPAPQSDSPIERT